MRATTVAPSLDFNVIPVQASAPPVSARHAINVDKTENIPFDYDGVMGVPITFMDKYNPQQFEILNANDWRKNDKVSEKLHGLIKDKDGVINGKATYARILIRRK